MADKKPTADNWPVVSGDYIVGDPESPVAVTTLASHNEDIPAAAGAAIAGPCKTENLGIEKVVANIISNPNIRFLILCGAEVQGHITGQSIQALHENGCDPEKKKEWKNNWKKSLIKLWTLLKNDLIPSNTIQESFYNAFESKTDLEFILKLI